MLMRQKISFGMGMTDSAVMMSEGNPGALNVLLQLFQRDQTDAFVTMLHLDDMNIRGSQIWIGYKDHCGQNLEKFIQCVKDRDEAMIEQINVEGRRGNHTHLAVKNGASFKEERPML